ncbi:MAG: COX15/CtaA family protein [Bacteroidota bacterium]
MANRWLHRFAIFTAFSTFILIFIGGLVTSTGSGLSVPDWPTTYGENMFTYPIDKWIGGIKYEHGHRLFASFVGFLTTVLAIWLAVKEERRWVKVIGFVALGLVILQGILGGLTVLFLLPTPVSIAHGMLAQTFFCLVSAIALFTSNWWRNGTVEIKKKGGYYLQLIVLSAVLSLFIQLGFGALLRHTYSGLAVPDFPLAYGQLFPSLNSESIVQYNQELIRDGIKWPGDKSIAAYQIVIHLVHRYWAFIVAAIVGFSGFKIYKASFLPKSIRRNGTILIAAVLIQFLLGMFTVFTRKEVIITTAHVALGAFTLVMTLLTLLQLMKVFGFNFTKEHFTD